MTDVSMPRLSDSMEQGTILGWLKADGEMVEVGDELVEIETDKATMTYESPEAGALTILAAVGDTLPVGAPIARVGVRDAAAKPPADSPAPPRALAAAQDASGTASAPATAPSAAPRVSPDGAGLGDVKVIATPIARRIAQAHGIDPATITGTGLRGRVTRADVAAAAGLTVTQRPADPPPAAEPDSPEPLPAPPLLPRAEPAVRELTRLQQTIARRMADAKATVPEFQVQTEVEMDAALVLRSQLKDAATDGEVVPSVNDLIVKSAALALRVHPLANGSFKDGRFELHQRVNVGIAVAAQDALVVPTITDADTRSLGSIAGEARRLAVRVRDGSITPPELSGGTFTVSNLGMYGMTAITPVINVPQAAILGVGASRTVLARDVRGEIVDRQLMTLTLTCDHRILYGADAARFLATIRDLLRQPLRLIL